MQPEANKIRLLKYLQDALSAAQEIEANAVGLPEQNFQLTKVKWIVEREIEIISKALKRAVSIEPKLEEEITDLAKIYGTRNKIAHQYDNVDPLLLYNIVTKNIPILIGDLTTIIDKTENKQ